MLQTAGLNSDKSLENELGSPGKSSILPGEDLSQRGVTWFLWRVLVVIIAFTVILWAISIFHTEQKHDLNIETNSMQGKGCSLIAKGRVSDRNTSIDVVDVFLLKTHLAGVSYTGDHWFHMSENFLTNHPSIERSAFDTTTTSDSQTPITRHIIYIFDHENFVTQTNAITRFLVLLGTTSSGSYSNTHGVSKDPYMVHYVYIPSDKYHADLASALAAASNGRSVELSESVPSADRFVKAVDSTPILHRLSREGNVCFRYHGAIGGKWPTPQRGHWFPSVSDVRSLRFKIAKACPPNSNWPSSMRKKYRLVIYQRDRSRKLENQAEAIAILSQHLPNAADWDIQVLYHTSDRSPCELARILFDVDVLMTPHGFQSMLLLFLPRPAILFEIFPYKYYKRAYGPLSTEYGVIHAGVMSPSTSTMASVLLSNVPSSWCIQDKQCRNYARNHDVRLTKRGVDRLVETVEANIASLGWQDKGVLSGQSPTNQTSAKLRCSIPSFHADPSNKRDRDYLYSCQ